jgi:hypothetical protein
VANHALPSRSDARAPRAAEASAATVSFGRALRQSIVRGPMARKRLRGPSTTVRPECRAKAIPHDHLYEATARQTTVVPCDASLFGGGCPGDRCAKRRRTCDVGRRNKYRVPNQATTRLTTSLLISCEQFNSPASRPPRRTIDHDGSSHRPKPAGGELEAVPSGRQALPHK